MTLIYTPDRHRALMLVARDQITALDSTMRGTDGTELPAGIVDGLVALDNGGYIQRRPTAVDAIDVGPVQLTVLGAQLLTWFDRHHARPVIQPGLLARPRPVAR